MASEGAVMPRPNGPIEGFTVTSAASVLIRRPVPRNLGISIVTSCEAHRQFEAMKALEPAMEPAVWLDMVLRCSANLPDSPMVVLEGLRRAFPHYRPILFLHGDAAEWWHNAKHPLTIWRGCYEGVNEEGMCYSQDPLRASLYVRPGACGRARALLIEAAVQHGDYIARRRDREGLELLVLPERPSVVARHKLPLPEQFFRDRTVPLREEVEAVVPPVEAVTTSTTSKRRRAK